MIIKDSLVINSRTRFQIIDITSYINENEEGLGYDIQNLLYDLIPESNEYSHDLIDHNAHSHLKSLFLSPQETVPIVDGRMDLGTWQSVFFIELDGPRSKRKIDLTIMGE